MDEKYDIFYGTSVEKKFLEEEVFIGWPCNRIQAILAMGGVGERVLDIGCGNGHLLFQYRIQFSQLIGLEYSEKRLQQARVNLADYNFIPILGSAEHIADIESDSVDQVVSSDTIEHIPDVYAAMEEIYRILKPGGKLIINTPNVAFCKKRIMLLLGRFPSTSQENEGISDSVLFDGGHLHYFTYRSLRLLLERVGFKTERRIGYGRYGHIQNLWPTLLSGGVQWVAVK